VSVQNAEIPSRIATHLFRCVQELLNNVAKHADAKAVWLTLRRDSRCLRLTIRDDGRGLAEENADHSKLRGSGIRNLRERAEMTGGKFFLNSPAGRGAHAHIVWTLEADEIG
jgi:two-component system NarL family sensor kinase